MSGVSDHDARELAASAERLISDPTLRQLLDEMIQIATETAITHAEPARREEARHEVLAVMKLRANLGVIIDNWKGRAAAAQRQKASE